MRARWIALIWLSLLLIPFMCSAATVTQINCGTQDTWITGSSNLTNNSLVQSATVSHTCTGYLGAYCTLNAPSWSGTVTAGSAISGWFNVSTDGGTTFEDSAVTPARPPDMQFALENVSTAQVLITRVDRMPVVPYKLLLKNDATGVTLQGATSNYTVKCRDFTLQIQ